MSFVENYVLFVLIVLIILANGKLDLRNPEIQKFEKVFKGEGDGTCQDTSAIIQINDQKVKKTEEDVIKAVSNAVAKQIQKIKENPEDEDKVLAAVKSSSSGILEVIATAVASVSGEVISPAEGCWGIAFGRAQAEAVANATVTAIAQAFGAVQENSVQTAKSEVVSSNVQQEIKVVVEEVALLLADGSGNGLLTDNRMVTAEATAQAINCALASAFGGIIDGESQAIVLALTGCDATEFGRSVISPIPQMFTIGCPCIDKETNGAPGQCGLYGDGDHICYVKSGQLCPCAVPSKRYNGLSWRYCGPTLEVMQSWLGFADAQHDIVPFNSTLGYCNAIDMKGVTDTVVNTPTPTPTPTTNPMPTTKLPGSSLETNNLDFGGIGDSKIGEVQLISNCPQKICPSWMSQCCNGEESICEGLGSGRVTYKYVGKCVRTEEDVWEPTVGFACRCDS